MRDTNRDYADFAARGDYANQIGAINAKVQDATLIQPTTSGQVMGSVHTRYGQLVSERQGQAHFT